MEGISDSQLDLKLNNLRNSFFFLRFFSSCEIPAPGSSSTKICRGLPQSTHTYVGVFFGAVFGVFTLVLVVISFDVSSKYF